MTRNASKYYEASNDLVEEERPSCAAFLRTDMDSIACLVNGRQIREWPAKWADRGWRLVAFSSFSEPTSKTETPTSDRAAH